jgi:hypothetical protein
MNSAKAPTLPVELGMPSRREGLLSLLIASPMTLLGCNTEPLPGETEGTSSSTSGEGSTTTTAVADSSTTSGGSSSSDDGTTSTGSSSSGDPSSSGPIVEVSTSSSGPDDTTSSGGEESTSTGGGMGQGNTCERVGDLMDMCFGGGYYGYGYWYESECTYNINYFIAAGDLACAQAYNEVYACIADLECAEVFNGIYNACEVQYDNLYALNCWNWGGTSFGWDTESGGWNDSGWWGTSGGWGGSEDSGWVGTGGWEDSGANFIVPGTSDGGWGGST